MTRRQTGRQVDADRQVDAVRQVDSSDEPAGSGVGTKPAHPPAPNQAPLAEEMWQINDGWTDGWRGRESEREGEEGREKEREKERERERVCAAA